MRTPTTKIFRAVVVIRLVSVLRNSRAPATGVQAAVPKYDVNRNVRLQRRFILMPGPVQKDARRGKHYCGDRSPFLDLMTCIDCNQAMKIEKIAPEGEG